MEHTALCGRPQSGPSFRGGQGSASHPHAPNTSAVPRCCPALPNSMPVHRCHFVKILRKSSPNYQRRQWHPTPVLLPGKSHGWRSLVGCRSWGLYESDTTERLHFHVSPSCFGEGNGNPLQCSCLENPRDGGAWWAAVYGVAQSRTQPKQLSSWGSSSSSSSPKYYWYTGTW